ncbi:hypothetical protein NEUTE1DRAFT_136437 [Neurospora tetrasperma FGSC 2508]|uniref:Uncharacterized protein n=1 Tax=Neurospora tetrasperma (strain FGSC 2508 / ATCC MYA-4615 / P0657) TaxID=510951 RepID=F8MG41_NEUT8|nr:uncharacterized protein NEUTE1DRAFT_136437 [Neurospora tetrasperma FGSC 2508]EGO59367.1 hypothetical protein NEUTE1DRAFT_136437 [Neurospora tetrasperma FGSC 2508]EGZ73491.1 hypothetical protein NEUTE2DRAFT_165624 [Neurospora tetrasperma FGSC 2509]
MSATNSVVICNGTNPPKKKNGDRLSKTLNPLAPEFVPKVLVSTPPDSGRSTFADPVHTPVKQDYPPYLGPYPFPGWRQEPYQGTGPQVPYQSPHGQAFNAPYQVGYAPYPAPAAAAYGYEPHTSFGRNITREVMAVLNNPSPPRPSTDGSQAPAYPTNAVSQTS